MRTLTALALLLAARATADAPAPDCRAAVALRLDRLTPVEAGRLGGKRALFWVRAKGAGAPGNGFRFYSCRVWLFTPAGSVPP